MDDLRSALAALRSRRLWLAPAWALAIPLALACGGDGEPAEAGSAPGEGPSVTFEDCVLEAPGSTATAAARCTTVTVAEDRSSEGSREIELAVAVIPAVARKPAETPLVLLAGGPGQGAREAYAGSPALRGALARIRRQRDILLVDQRGTGASHPLACEATPLTTLLDPEQAARWRETLVTLAEECVEDLQADGTDLTRFTTSAAVEDLEEVRRTLGYPRLDLYGISYGTRMALSYLRRYPQSVRTVILDGVVPQDLALGEAIAADAQRVMEIVFERCRADADCTEAFPQLEEDFRAVMESLEGPPELVEARHPATAERLEVPLDRRTLAGALRLQTYFPETLALVPLLVTDARASSDLSRLAAQILMVDQQFADAFSLGMMYTVVCAEDVPFIDRQRAEEHSGSSYMRLDQVETMEVVCAHWPRAEIPEDYKQPVVSDVPVLLLSGDADPVTPPAYGDRVAEGLSNSLHLVAPGMGHNVLPRGCLPKVAASFVEAGSLEGLETECVQDLEPPPFFLSFGGPAP